MARCFSTHSERVNANKSLFQSTVAIVEMLSQVVFQFLFQLAFDQTCFHRLYYSFFSVRSLTMLSQIVTITVFFSAYINCFDHALSHALLFTCYGFSKGHALTSYMSCLFCLKFSHHAGESASRPQ